MSAVTLTSDMPIQIGHQLKKLARQGGRPVVVRKIPKDMFADAHERRCEKNHQQTLERIRERGGFDAIEAVAVLSCLPFEAVGAKEEAAHYILYEMIAAFNRGGLLARRTLTDPVNDGTRG